MKTQYGIITKNGPMKICNINRSRKKKKKNIEEMTPRYVYIK